MQTIKTFWYRAAAVLLLASALGACEREGPAERAGERIDESAERAGENLEDAGDRLEDQTDR